MSEGIKKNHIILFVALFLFWVVLSPKIDIASVVLGLIVAVLITLFNSEMIINREERPISFFRNIFNFTSYLLTLIIEIVKSNIEVAKIVLSPSLPINPHFVRVPVKARKEIFKVMYGNSITLTPGTLTVEITDDEYIVHALTDSAAKGLNNSKMEKKILKIEGGHNG
jgi:multicomponent Na+:H+ antiporter subunit E